MESSYGVPLFFAIVGGMAAGAFIHCTGLSPWHSDYSVSMPFAVIAGLWICYPFHKMFHEVRATFLHPDPTRYTMPLPDAFAAIREILQDTVINMGDQWNVYRADTNARIIKAQLRFTGKDAHFAPGALVNIVEHQDFARRFIKLEAKFIENADNTTSIVFDFSPQVEGNQVFACDRVIRNFYKCVDASLGAGTIEPTESRRILAAPPWWLIAVSAVALVPLFFRISGWITG